MSAGKLVQPKTVTGAASSSAGGGRPGYLGADPAHLGLVSGGGQALAEPVRGKMEAALGADFSTVRVHVGSQASRIGAAAFTLGSDIYFAYGQFSPETAQGQRLLGHELAHVIQQRQGRVPSPGGSRLAISLDPSLEAEAERLGEMAARHLGAGPATGSHSAVFPAPGAVASLQQKPTVSIQGGIQRSVQQLVGSVLRIGSVRSPGAGQNPAPRSARQGFYIQRSTSGAGGAQKICVTGSNSPMQIGSLQLWPKGNGVIELTNMHVQRDYRCQGAGKMLMNAALQCARTQGFSTVRLAASPYDGEMTVQALTAMYQRMGFQAAGVSGRGHPVMQQKVNAAVPSVPGAAMGNGRIFRGPLQAKMAPGGRGSSRGRVIQRMEAEFVSGFVEDIKGSYKGRNDSGVVFGEVQHRPPRTYAPSEVDVRFLRLVSNYFFWYANSICTKDEAEVECMWVNNRLFLSANNTQTMKQIFEHMKVQKDVSETLRSQWKGDGRGTQMMDTFDDIYQSPETSSSVAQLLQGLSFESIRDAVHLVNLKAVGTAITSQDCFEKIILVDGYSRHAEQKLMVGLASSTLSKQSPIVIRGKKRPCFGCWLGLCFVSEVLGFTNLQFNEFQGKAWVGSVKTLGSLYQIATTHCRISKGKIEEWIKAKNQQDRTKKTYVTTFGDVEDPGYDSGSDHENSAF